MTPNEAAILTYLLKKGTATDSQIQNQCHVTSGSLLTIMRSLKTKLLVEQDGRHYRPLKLAEEALRERPPRQPFGGQPVW